MFYDENQKDKYEILQKTSKELSKFNLENVKENERIFQETIKLKKESNKIDLWIQIVCRTKLIN